MASVVTVITPVHAAAPFEASDVLGQTDIFGNPDFTKAYENNGKVWGHGFYEPQDIAIDGVNHRAFISDAGANRVLVFNLDNNNRPDDYFADFVLGQPDLDHETNFQNDNNAQGFCSPYGLEYDSETAYLFVADFCNHRILVFDVSTITNNEDAIYVLGQADFTSTGSDTNAKGFNGLFDISLDSANDRLYVADRFNSRILVFDVSTITNNEDAIYVLGQADFTSTGSDTNAKGFQEPTGVSYDSSSEFLYVADFLNHRVLVFDTSVIANNMDASYVLGQPDYTTTNQDTNAKGFYFSNRPSLTVDPSSQRLFVPDQNGRRVLVFDVSTISNNEDAVYVLGQPDFTSSGVDTSAQGVSGAYDADYDPVSESLFVADSGENRILIFDLSGGITNNMDAVDILGQIDSFGAPHFTKNGQYNNVSNFSYAEINATGFRGPYTTAFDTVNHRMFVSDRWNQRVLVFNLNESDELVDRTADYVIGQPDFTSRVCNSPSETEMCGEVFGIAYDEINQRLFVSNKDNDRILIYDDVSPSNISNGMAADYVLGQANFSSVDCNRGNPGTNAGRLCAPFDLAYDPDEEYLYAADRDNNRVVAYDVAPGTITNGEDAVRVFGQANFTSKQANRGGSVGVNTLNKPRGLDVNTVTNQLFVNDTNNNRIVNYNISSGEVSNGPDALNVIGQQDFNSDGVGTSVNELYNPHDIGVDATKNKLYVNDENNYRVLIFDIESIVNGEDAVGVIGQADFDSSDDEGVGEDADSTHFSFTTGLTVNPTTHDIFLGDSYYHSRFLIFSFADISLGDGTDTPATVPTATFGVPYDYELPIDGTQGTVTCELTDGTLPQGMSITSDCHIKGTPASNTVYTFTVTVTDDNGAIGTFSDSQVLGLTVNHASGSGELVDTGVSLTANIVIASSLILLASANYIFRPRSFRRIRLVNKSGR